MNNPLAVATAAPSSPTTISAFANEGAFTSAQRMARALCSSTLVPENYRGEANIGNALIALELSHRVGASVMAVMQSMTPIHGKPSWSAAFLIATVNTCGRFTPLRFRWQGQEGTDAWGCRAVAKEKESGEELVGSLITIGMAKAEGWYSKAGSKWKTMPEQMLTYRAAAFWTRAYAPELSLGMVTSEEAHDIAATERRRGPSTEQIREQFAAPAPQAQVSKAEQPAVADAVVVEQEPSKPETSEPEPEPEPKAQTEPTPAPSVPADLPSEPPPVEDTVESVLAQAKITYSQLVELATSNQWWEKPEDYTEPKWLPAEVKAWIIRNRRGIARAGKKFAPAE